MLGKRFNNVFITYKLYLSSLQCLTLRYLLPSEILVRLLTLLVRMHFDSDVTLDEGRHIIVRTPISHRRWKKKKYWGFPKGTSDMRALIVDAVRVTGRRVLTV